MVREKIGFSFLGLEIAPVFGSIYISNITPFCCINALILPAWQVNIFWQMLAYFTEQDHSKPILWMSFDETSVSFSPDSPVGCVVAKQHWRSQRSYVKGPHRKIKKERRRGAYTYCATICSNTTVQAALPHFLLARKAGMSNKLFRGFHALPRTRLQLLRQSTAWATSQTMITIFKELKKALVPFLASYRPILMLDCASAHLPKQVMRAARRQGLQLLFVPSSVTGLVQAADIYAFGPFKSYLRNKYQELRESATDGQPEALAMLWQLGEAPREFFSSRPWQKAFKSIGTSQNVSELHSSLAEFMQYPPHFPLPVKPLPAEVSRIWPSKRKMAYAYAILFG